jgi:hypothetical protein
MNRADRVRQAGEGDFRVRLRASGNSSCHAVGAIQRRSEQGAAHPWLTADQQRAALALSRRVKQAVHAGGTRLPALEHVAILFRATHPAKRGFSRMRSGVEGPTVMRRFRPRISWVGLSRHSESIIPGNQET